MSSSLLFLAQAVCHLTPARHAIDFPASVGKTALTADQEAFEFEQRQNRGWLHSQISLPGGNGITKWQHEELLRYFSKRTLEERERPPLLREGLKLSMISQEHLARLNQERNEEKKKRGVAPDMTTHVEDWWTKGPVPPGREGQKAGGKRPRPDNRKAKRIRNFIERKNKETEQKAIAEREQVRKQMSRMQIGDEVAEAIGDSEEGEGSDEEVAMEGVDEQKESIAPQGWVGELTFRGPKP